MSAQNTPQTEPVKLTMEKAAQAFEMWETSFRKNPSQFLTEEESRASAVADYGLACAIHFMALLRCTTEGGPA